MLPRFAYPKNFRGLFQRAAVAQITRHAPESEGCEFGVGNMLMVWQMLPAGRTGSGATEEHGAAIVT